MDTLAMVKERNDLFMREDEFSAYQGRSAGLSKFSCEIGIADLPGKREKKNEKGKKKASDFVNRPCILPDAIKHDA